MKVKIRELSNTVIPRYIYSGNKDIFSLKITDKFKYISLPTKILAPLVNNAKQFLIFYDGITTSTELYTVTAGRAQSSLYNSMGAEFMYFLQLGDSHFQDPTRVAGWTAGSPYYYITSREIPFLVDVLVDQGLTSSDNGYVYINWHEDDRDFIQYGGYTGPLNGVSAAEHSLLSKTMAKIITGGTGIDGISFYGLKYYFPNVKFGFYNVPKWTYYFGNDVSPQRNIWDKERTGGITALLNYAADVVVSASELMDAVDLLMPSVYSAVNSRTLNRTHSRQAVTLCHIINQKLTEQGKQKKEIIPFLCPFYQTDQTGSPYDVYNYEPTFPNFQYSPPFTIMLDSDIKYEQVEPIIQEGADGAIVWVSSSYLTKTIAGRSTIQDEDTPIGIASWRLGPTAGVTNPWSFKSLKRQAISAHEAYIQGVCMGVTGNRWWWATEISGSTAYIPPEWYPLGTNKVAPNFGATSGITAIQLIQNTLEDAKIRTINILKEVSDLYNNG